MPVLLAMAAFQSTLPTRGSEISIFPMCARSLFQSTLPTRGSETGDDRAAQQADISIHAPHEGERRSIRPPIQAKMPFQSTLPTRGSDCASFAPPNSLSKFQSTLPTRGSDAEKCICMQHFREFTEYYPLRHGDARCIAPQDCIIQAFFGAKKRCFYVRLCFALKNKGVRG